ncbi:MAG: dihydroorotate dehydrogenase electron transfer subunit, partial [Solobacterium sp.]|nr:dihydroorotate dehydrogenase electron transfer subunit [Solobacterium sp.]
GSFVNLTIPGLFLRRPISVCDVNGDELTIIFRVVGHGTEKLSAMEPGEKLSVLLELGNGYDLSRAGDRPLLIGGGVGIPPLYYLAKKLHELGKEVTAVLGFNTASELFYTEEFQRYGKVIVTTADGSVGVRGFVSDALPEGCSFFYACGPLPMEKALYKKLNIDGQFSLEERMGCGFGACMGCSFMTKLGSKRICREGPVFDREVLPWDE